MQGQSRDAPVPAAARRLSTSREAVFRGRFGAMPGHFLEKSELLPEKRPRVQNNALCIEFFPQETDDASHLPALIGLREK